MAAEPQSKAGTKNTGNRIQDLKLWVNELHPYDEFFSDRPYPVRAGGLPQEAIRTPREIAKTRPGLRNLFDKFDDDVKAYFDEFHALVDSQFSLHVLLAYCFFRLEQGQRVTLFCGARKLHKTDSELTWKAIDGHYMSRENFQKFFEVIFSVPIPAGIQEIIKPAEDIRDKLMHGRGLDEGEVREAISRVLHYPDQINRSLDDRNAGFRPFEEDLRGFVGRLEALDKSTSRWILKGMGFQLA